MECVLQRNNKTEKRRRKKKNRCYIISSLFSFIYSQANVFLLFIKCINE